ncbi:hypothetical protein F8388_019763 [Cannabis sativa]|uniref:Reverse transcriptase zinc-binding domain-containing protein n=1 Tax=Cannabis sativa TaxID=3483 RepID=A0A7J6EXT8_CANSA|nr:hypothetical protein F8388_019763 [Cannabis sativa]
MTNQHGAGLLLISMGIIVKMVPENQISSWSSVLVTEAALISVQGKHSRILEKSLFCRDFVWGVLGNRSKFHRVSWDKVCLPKDLGAVTENKFSTKRCYNLLVEGTKTVFAGAIWDKLVVPKHGFIYWQIANNHLLTRVFLQRFMAIPSRLCPVCENDMETHDHVAAAVNSWLGDFQWPTSTAEMIQTCCNLKEGLVPRLWNAVLAATLLSMEIRKIVQLRIISKGPYKECIRNKYVINKLKHGAIYGKSYGKLNEQNDVVLWVEELLLLQWFLTKIWY